MENNKIIILVIFIFSLFPILSLFNPGLPITHDGQEHVARIANFYQNIKEGNIVPRWAGNLNWGYGHPILMFLYPFSSYTASFFHFIGFSLVDSIKIVFGLAYILSGFSMYFFVKELLNSKAGLVAALLYLYAPYRFIDLYVRGAIGEHVAFIFPPLICYFFLKLSRKYSYINFIGLAISFAFLILSHNAISIMFIPIILFFVFFIFVKYKKNINVLIINLAGIIIGFGISSFFILPAYFEGKYTLRDIVTQGEYFTRFVELKSFFYGEWNYGISGQFSVQIGIIHWIFVLSSLIFFFLFFKKRKDNIILLQFFLFVFFVSIFLMTSYSNFIWEKISLLQKFQFPWRFLTLTVFASSMLGGILFSYVKDKYQFLLALLVVFAVFIINIKYLQANGYSLKQESFYKDVYFGTTDTGESAPIWSIRFMEREPSAKIEVIDGEASIEPVDRRINSHKYRIESKNESRIRENTIYFPGWKVFMNGKNVPIEFQDQKNRGLITFYVPKGKHNLEIRFSDTKLRLFSNIVSIISFLILLFWGILYKNRIWQKFR